MRLATAITALISAKSPPNQAKLTLNTMVKLINKPLSPISKKEED